MLYFLSTQLFVNMFYYLKKAFAHFFQMRVFGAHRATRMFAGKTRVHLYQEPVSDSMSDVLQKKGRSAVCAHLFVGLFVLCSWAMLFHLFFSFSLVSYGVLALLMTPLADRIFNQYLPGLLNLPLRVFGCRLHHAYDFVFALEYLSGRKWFSIALRALFVTNTTVREKTGANPLNQSVRLMQDKIDDIKTIVFMGFQSTREHFEGYYRFTPSMLSLKQHVLMNFRTFEWIDDERGGFRKGGVNAIVVSKAQELYMIVVGLEVDSACALIADAWELCWNRCRLQLKYARMLYNRVKKKYPSQNITIIGQSMGNYAALGVDLIRCIEHPNRTYPKTICIAPRRSSQAFVSTLVEMITPYVSRGEATPKRVQSILAQSRFMRFFPDPCSDFECMGFGAQQQSVAWGGESYRVHSNG